MAFALFNSMNYMLEQLILILNSGSYTLKRMFHPQLTLAYHVHFKHSNKNLVFRIEKQGSNWKIIPSSNMPRYVFAEELIFIRAICENEKEPGN